MIPVVGAGALHGMLLGAGKASVEQVAESFEALFISKMIHGLRAAYCGEEEGRAGLGKAFYTDWFEQALSEAVAQAGGIGIKAAVGKWVQAGHGEENHSNTISYSEKVNQSLRRFLKFSAG